VSIRLQFRRSIECGTGKAYLILRDNPAMDFSREITRAALTNLAYDPQCEGDRAEYVARLIELSNNKQVIIDCVLQALGSERNDPWALYQRESAFSYCTPPIQISIARYVLTSRK